MWISNKQINKLVPTFVSEKPTRVDFLNVRKFNSYLLANTSTFENYKLFKLTFSNFNVDSFSTLTISPTIVFIKDTSNDVYEQTSLELISNTKSYILPYNGLETSKIETFYVLSDNTNTLNIDLNLEISNINNYTQLYTLLTNSFNIKEIIFKNSYYSTGMSVDKEFLENCSFSLDNVVEIIYTLDLNLTNSSSLFFNSIVNIVSYNLKVFDINDEDYLSNYYDLEVINYKLDTYYKLLSIEDVNVKHAILNSDKIITIN